MTLLDQGRLKRLFDFTVALAFSILALPLAVVVALAVRLRLGSPVVFAQQRVGLGGRVACVGGDFHAGLPAGADTISLVRVVHDHDDAPAQSLLRAVHAALPPGGRLILAEPMAGTAGAEPVGDAYFGFYLMAMGSGRPRTREELVHMLRKAGFETVTERRTRRPLLVRVLMAHKSGTPPSS